MGVMTSVNSDRDNQLAFGAAFSGPKSNLNHKRQYLLRLSTV